ncbi:MbcA/ParS/Xre antitoxin family protein [Vibrio coralliirubri]|uniref:MbcA/ParS/Xre antitoxin family protein n=1 Tax=Vibrio coralliirubri TaxID=1516159 RepID=UPI00076AB7B2|nr:MbcA/ParS/Xre antitoxin family protein [Vibrio coralliirubri]
MEEEVKKLLFEFSKQDEIVNQWLNTPKWFFDNLTPLEMIKKPGGHEALITILNRIHYGDFS